MKRQSCRHIETSQFICRTDQLTGFYMMATLAFKVDAQFVQKVTFEPLMDFKQIHYGS